MATAAFIQGIFAASSLVIGAFIGVFWRLNRKISAAIMAFGSGILLSAIAFDIAYPIYQKTSFWPLLVGFTIGGILFNTLSQYVDEKGGFLRKPASSRRYLVEHSLDPQNILQRTAHIEVMQQLPESEKRKLTTLLTPIQVETGYVLCQEGEYGDYLYMIVNGEAEIRKGKKVIITLGPGEIVGEMSLITGEPRSATVIAATSMELYQLHRDNFAQVITQSPYLAWALSRTLARRLRLSVDSQVAAEQYLEKWQRQLMAQVQLEQFWEMPSTLEVLVKRSTPVAILVGTLLDNIPESIVIGINTQTGITWSFLLAVFIANFPEALSSAAGMKQAGTPRSQILGLWLGVVIFSGVWAICGYWLHYHISELLVAVTEAIAGGAILAMLASTMMPEAYELGGSSVAYSTIAGFLLGFLMASYGF